MNAMSTAEPPELLPKQLLLVSKLSLCHQSEATPSQEREVNPVAMFGDEAKEQLETDNTLRLR
jgi:hypothetical protein